MWREKLDLTFYDVGMTLSEEGDWIKYPWSSQGSLSDKDEGRNHGTDLLYWGGDEGRVYTIINSQGMVTPVMEHPQYLTKVRERL